jgi:2-dehydropantoate 2-reductase
LFTAAGLQTTVSSNIMQTIWEKLLVNVSTGALCAITGLPYGKLYAVPDVEATALAAVAEAMVVAKASGVALTTTDPMQPWLKAAAGLPPEFKTLISSMALLFVRVRNMAFPPPSIKPWSPASKALKQR